MLPGAGLLFAVLAALGSALTVPTVHAAQSDQPPPVSASPEQLRDLRATLQNPDKRARLIQQIDALITASDSGGATDEPEAGPGMLSVVTGGIDQATEEVTQLTAVLGELPGVVGRVRRSLRDPAYLRDAGQELLHGIATLLAALLLGALAQRFLRRARRAVLPSPRSPGWFVVLSVFLRSALSLLPLALALAAAYTVLALTGPADVTRTATIAIAHAVVVYAGIRRIAAECFNPDGARPILGISPETGAYLYVWIRRIASVTVFASFGVVAAVDLGLPSGAGALMSKLLGLLVAGMLVVLVLQIRAGVARVLQRGRSLPGGRGRLAEIWHVFAITGIVGVYVAWVVGSEAGIAAITRTLLLSIAIVLATVILAMTAGRVTSHLMGLGSELRRRYPGLEHRSDLYLPAIRAVVSGIVYALGILTLLEAWGLEGLEWLQSPQGRAVSGTVISLLFTVGGSLLVLEISTVVLERALRPAAGQSAAARSARRNTLLPLARNTLRLTVAGLAGLVILAELGINIGPLLAGAGVIGLAIGFGAQSLVRDLITGAFILVEDSVSVGDWVELGSHSGQVETLSIRSIRLRDLAGHVHTVPFSEVSTVVNMTRDYNYAVVDVGVAYREDVDEVQSVLQTVADELAQDTEYSDQITGPLEIYGLNELGDSAVEIRVRLKTRAGRHWPVRREFLRRVKRAFDDQGIEIPFPHRTLYFGADRNGEAPPASVVVTGNTASGRTEQGDENQPASDSS
ncbi:MAG: mechanosensitive ion channel [Ectothiorhodospiraceae bacterium]